MVYRAGKLPKELPEWFQRLDTEHEGQIGLYKWKNSGRPLQEFEAMDLNHDGFLTIDEVLRYVKAHPEMAATQVAGANMGSPGSPPMDSFGSGQGPPNQGGQRRFGRGGSGNGPPNAQSQQDSGSPQDGSRGNGRRNRGGGGGGGGRGNRSSADGGQ